MRPRVVAEVPQIRRFQNLYIPSPQVPYFLATHYSARFATLEPLYWRDAPEISSADNDYMEEAHANPHSQVEVCDLWHPYTDAAEWISDTWHHRQRRHMPDIISLVDESRRQFYPAQTRPGSDSSTPDKSYKC